MDRRLFEPVFPQFVATQSSHKYLPSEAFAVSYNKPQSLPFSFNDS